MAQARDKILERRAAFVAASLAVAGCGATTTPPTTTPSPAASASASASATPVASAPEPEPAAPKGVSPEMAKRYRAMHEEARTIGLSLDKVEQGLDACKGGTAAHACVTAREEAAKELHLFDGRIRSLRIICKGKGEEERAYEAASNAEAKRLGDRRYALEERWKKAVGENDWLDAMTRASMANPVPCLSIVCKEWW